MSMVIGYKRDAMRLARFSHLPDTHPEPDVMSLSVAVILAGKTGLIESAMKLLAKTFSGRPFFFADKCPCGQPNCPNPDFGVIGYPAALDGQVMIGPCIPLLRYDLVGEEPS